MCSSYQSVLYSFTFLVHSFQPVFSSFLFLSFLLWQSIHPLFPSLFIYSDRLYPCILFNQRYFVIRDSTLFYFLFLLLFSLLKYPNRTFSTRVLSFFSFTLPLFFQLSSLIIKQEHVHTMNCKRSLELFPGWW